MTTGDEVRFGSDQSHAYRVSENVPHLVFSSINDRCVPCRERKRLIAVLMMNHTAYTDLF